VAGLKEMIVGLGKLSKPELGQLRNALDNVGAPSSSATSGPQTGADWLFDGILYELQRRGLSYPKLPKDRLNSLAPNYFADSVPIMTNLRVELLRVKKRIPGATLRQAELDALGRKAARELARLLQGGPAPMSLRTMLVNVLRIPEALEASYPGYLASGMILHLIGKG
jgi:hypothetical protein